MISTHSRSTASADTAPPSPHELTRRVSEAARALGFTRVGFTTAAPVGDGKVRLEQFLQAGFAGTMDYLAEGPRHDPRALLAEAKSVIVVALAYGAPSPAPPETSSPSLAGRVARYAQGSDYHIVLKQKLDALSRELPALAGRPVRSRACVDTAPLLERELAARAGIGFHGKSTLLIAPGAGSYVLLGELLVDVELEPSPQRAAQSCGSCRACLDACPTDAFVEPHVLDARRCISYLTIESAGDVPRELRSALGDRVFGCDACQEVCPYNFGQASLRASSEALSPRPELATLDLVALLGLGAASYRKLVRRSALRRTSRATLQRNAAVALGNSDDPRAVRPLASALEQNPSALVRRHAAWALGRLARHADAGARRALRRALDFDPDPEVRREAAQALSLATRPLTALV